MAIAASVSPATVCKSARSALAPPRRDHSHKVSTQYITMADALRCIEKASSCAVRSEILEVLLYIQASQEFSQAFQGFYPAFLRQIDNTRAWLHATKLFYIASYYRQGLSSEQRHQASPTLEYSKHQVEKSKNLSSGFLQHQRGSV